MALGGCAWHPPAEPPALAAASGPVSSLALPAAEPLSVAVRAGSAHDPPGREGLAWVTAHAIADSVGAEVEVGPEVVVFRIAPERADVLAAALAARPSDAGIATARESAGRALAGLSCRELAERVWDGWIYTGHPYGHAPEGRLSVLPTLTPAEVAAFQQVRYVRSVVVVGIPAGVDVALAAFDVLPARLSASPVPAVQLSLPTARALVVRAEGMRCVVVGHPAASADARTEAVFDPGDAVGDARRQPRHLAFLPLAPELAVGSLLADLFSGGWFPLWQASRVFAPEAPLPAARAVADELMRRDPWPSLARRSSPDGLADAASIRLTTTAGASLSPAADGPARLDAALAGWLTPAESRAVVVLPPGVPFSFESPGVSIVQVMVPAQELLR